MITSNTMEARPVCSSDRALLGCTRRCTSSGIHRAAASHHVRSEALRDSCRRCSHRVLCEVGVARGGLDLPVAEQLPIIDRLSPSASAREAKAVTQVMQAHVLKVCTTSYDEPRRIWVTKPRTGLSTGNHPWIVYIPRNRGEYPYGRWRQTRPAAAPSLYRAAAARLASRSTSSQRSDTISPRRQPVSISRRIAATALAETLPSASTSPSTRPSLRNSSSERNRSRLRSLYFCTNLQGLPPSGPSPHASAVLNSRESMSMTRFAMVGVLVQAVLQRGDFLAPDAAERPRPKHRGGGACPGCIDMLSPSPACTAPRHVPSCIVQPPRQSWVRHPAATAARAGSSPALMLAMNCAALRRARSADTTPCRPIVMRLDLPARAGLHEIDLRSRSDICARRILKAHGPRTPLLAHRRAVPSTVPLGDGCAVQSRHRSIPMRRIRHGGVGPSLARAARCSRRYSRRTFAVDAFTDSRARCA